MRKEKSAKAGQHWDIKKTNSMTAEEICNFNIGNEDIKIVEDFA